MDLREEQVVLETDRYRIVGLLTLPREGYRSRLSDYVNQRDREFFAVSDVTITALDDTESTRRASFIMVARRHVTLLARAFTRSGAQVVEAEDGAAGMRAIYADKPDAVLLDIEMPGIDGFGALERIRDLTDVPVMMLTSSDDKDVKLRAFEGGADDYVTKPFD